MKKLVLFGLLAFLIAFSFAACRRGTSDPTILYTITFNSNGGTAIQPRQVPAGTTLLLTVEPTREGFVFAG